MSSSGTTENIDAVTLTIEKVFKETYVIPDYQREYRWVKKNLTDLWLDLEGLVSSASGGSVHYLGTIYCEKDGEKRNLIDGQQRLTTLQLIWGVLQAHAAELTFVKGSTEEKDLRSLTSQLDAALYETRDGSQYLRVVSNYEAEFATELLEAKRTRQERDTFLSDEKHKSKQLKTAYQQLDEKLADDLEMQEEDEKKLDRLVSLHRALATQMKLVRIDVSGDLRVHEIFESLNAKGRNLDTFEIVKSYLFGKASSEGVLDATLPCWTSFANRFRDHRLGLDDVLQYYVTSLNEKTAEKNVFANAKPFIMKDPLGFARDLDAFSERIFDVYDINSSLLDSGKESAKNIKMFNYKYVYMLVGATHPIPLDDLHFNQFLQDLETFLFRFLVVKPKDTTQLTKMQNLMKNHTYEASERIEIGAEKFQSEVRQEFKSATSDLNFISAFKVYSEKTRSRQEYVLKKFEDYYNAMGTGGGGVTPLPVGKKLNHIEHIYPKAPHDGYSKGYDHSTDQWKEFREYHDPDEQHFSEQNRIEMLNRIGNLMILESKLNQSIQNANITVKIEGKPGAKGKKNLVRYLDSTLHMPKQVCQQASKKGVADKGPYEWTPSHVKERQSLMASEAVDIWKF